MVAVAGPHAIAAVGDVTGYDVPTPTALPHGVARGPDGAIWFTEQLASTIGRLTTDGTFSEHPLEPGVDPTAITVGPDGNLWFVEQLRGRIGRITPWGDLVEFDLSDPSSRPVAIAPGPDGALWFVERGASQIGRISTDGLSLDEWPTPSPNASPRGIAAGPDGAMWFTERNAGRLGRIDVSGSSTDHVLPTGSTPTGIAAGSDGNLWVTLVGRNSIGRVTMSGVLDTEFPLPTTGAGASHIVAGPEGALWFTETTVDQVGRITVSGAIREFPLASGATPQGIVEGPDGAPWFAEANANRIARLDIGASAPADTTAPTIEIMSPPTGTPLVLGQQDVMADYRCEDEPGGSGIAECAGPVDDGTAVPTDSVGARSFLVEAGDAAGNETEGSTGYVVFSSIDGSMMGSAVRPGKRLKLVLGMDLDRHASDPLETATWHEVSCDDPTQALGDEQGADVETRVRRHGSLKLRWRTDRSWGGRCVALTLTFWPTGWTGAPATFVAEFTSRHGR